MSYLCYFLYPHVLLFIRYAQHKGSLERYDGLGEVINDRMVKHNCVGFCS